LIPLPLSSLLAPFSNLSAASDPVESNAVVTALFASLLSTAARYRVEPNSTRNIVIAEAMAMAPGAAVYVSIQKSGRHGSDKASKALGIIYMTSMCVLENGDT
jgi:hypothetical protein